MQYRNTKQKSTIYSIIDQNGHVSVEELVRYLRQINSKISLATIYRNLNVLTKENKIKKVQSANKLVFETIKENHYHFECEKCHKIFDIDLDLINIKINHSPATITRKELFLYGICNGCNNNNE